MNAIKVDTTIDEAMAQALPALRPLLGQRVELIALQAEEIEPRRRKLPKPRTPGKATTIPAAAKAPPKGTRMGSTPRERFEAHVARWRLETGGWSNPHKIVAHPSYRAIVAMGADALPLILADLAGNDDADFWGPALREITGETVKIAPADVGRLDAVAKAWLALAKQKGWLPRSRRRA